MSYLRYLCLIAYSGLQHIHVLCCVFLCFVYPMLPVSLDCPFSIAPSVFSNIYFHVWCVQIPVIYYKLKHDTIINRFNLVILK